jgi:hypothetical protein
MNPEATFPNRSDAVFHYFETHVPQSGAPVLGSSRASFAIKGRHAAAFPIIEMKFSLALLTLGIFAAPAPAPVPGVIKDVADQVFPLLTTAVQQASVDSVDAVKKALLADVSDFMAQELSKIPLLPKSAEDKIRVFLENRVINKVADVVSNTIKKELPPKVGRIMGAIQNEVNIIDGQVDEAVAEFRNRLRNAVKLPPK